MGFRKLCTFTEASHRRCSVKKRVVKNFANFTGKQLKACNFIKKRLQHRCFPEKFLRTSIFKNICEQLLLNLLKMGPTWNVNFPNTKRSYFLEHLGNPFSNITLFMQISRSRKYLDILIQCKSI